MSVHPDQHDRKSVDEISHPAVGVKANETAERRHEEDVSEELRSELEAHIRGADRNRSNQKRGATVFGDGQIETIECREESQGENQSADQARPAWENPATLLKRHERIIRSAAPACVHPRVESVR